MEEKKVLIIKVYQEKSSMRGIERTFGVSRRTSRAWLKEQANDLPVIADNIRSMRRYRREVTASQEATTEVLKRSGIFTKTGRVASPYKDLLSDKKAGISTNADKAV